MCEVTVVIPTWNRWQLLSRAALPAALAQQGVEVEIVVVDDGSTDETSSRLAEMAARESRLRVVTHRTRRGVAQARNAGIEAARGEWVAFLDDDDLWSPEKLRRQLLAARSADAELVYSGAIMLDTAWRAIAAEPPPSPIDLARTLLSRNLVPAGCSNVMVTRALLRRHGGFDEQLYQLADWDLWLRLALDTRAACTPEPLVGYATHPENMVIATGSDVMKELDYLQRKHEVVSRAYEAHFDRLWLARWAAGSNRRAGRRVRAAALYLRAGVEHRSRPDVVRAGSVLARRLVPSVVARLVFSATARLRGVESRSRVSDRPREPDWLRSYRSERPGKSASTSPVRFAAIVDSGYLARLLVMIESLHEVSPGLPVDVLCMDGEAERLLETLDLDCIRAIAIEELEAYDPDLPVVRHERSLAEYCWTAKPSLCRFLFERHPDAEEIVYADADLMFFHDPESVLAELRGGSALVVPHRAPPGEDWERSRGAYNAGFVAFRRSPDTTAILEWWRERCLEWCFARVEPGRFCDQMYLDEWPRRFSGVRILGNVGGGLAPWNASRHRLTMRSGLVWLDDEVPLVFFHFQSLDVYRGLVGGLARLGLLPDRFHSVPDHGSLSWSVWASYTVSNDAERHVYVPYAQKLATAASRLAGHGQTQDGTYRGLATTEIVRELARGNVPSPVRRALRRGHASPDPDSPMTPTVRDEPPASRS